MDRANNKQKTEIRILGGIILLGIVVVASMKWLFPANYTPYLWLIPANFLVMGIGLMLLFSPEKRKRLNPGREIALLMLFSVGQMILSFSLLFCYYFFIQEQKNTMLITFCIFYLFFIGLKFFIFLSIDKRGLYDK